MAEQAEAVARRRVVPWSLWAFGAGGLERPRLGNLALVAATTGAMVARGEGRWLTVAHWAVALLNNGLCRYDLALVAAEKASEYPDELGLATRSLVELIEAAARTGHAERAGAALQRLSEATRAGGTDGPSGSRLARGDY